jgi:hypothetical protein
MKKEYMKPQIEVVKVNMSCQILAGSDSNVTGVSGNVFNGGISGGSGGGRSRGSDDWEDE